jgi:hypothetical protein
MLLMMLSTSATTPGVQPFMSTSSRQSQLHTRSLDRAGSGSAVLVHTV